MRCAAGMKSHRAENAFSNVGTVQRLSPVGSTRTKTTLTSLALSFSPSPNFLMPSVLGRTYEDFGVYGQVRAPSGGLQVGAPSLFRTHLCLTGCKTFSISQKRFKVLTDKEPKCCQSEKFEKCFSNEKYFGKEFSEDC